MSSPNKIKPGQKAPESGQYIIVNRLGNKIGLEVTAIKGKRMPPTDKSGQGYILVDKTKHKK